MALPTLSSAASSSSTQDREVLGYWNPSAIVAKGGKKVALSSKYGIPLYADDPVHQLLFNKWSAGDADADITVVGYIRANKKKAAEVEDFEL